MVGEVDEAFVVSMPSPGSGLIDVDGGLLCLDEDGPMADILSCNFFNIPTLRLGMA